MDRLLDVALTNVRLLPSWEADGTDSFGVVGHSSPDRVRRYHLDVAENLRKRSVRCIALRDLIDLSLGDDGFMRESEQFVEEVQSTEQSLSTAETELIKSFTVREKPEY